MIDLKKFAEKKKNDLIAGLWRALYDVLDCNHSSQPCLRCLAHREWSRHGSTTAEEDNNRTTG